MIYNANQFMSISINDKKPLININIVFLKLINAIVVYQKHFMRSYQIRNILFKNNGFLIKKKTGN